MYAPTRTNAQTPTNICTPKRRTGGLPSQRGAGGGKLLSLGVFTLLVVEKNGKKRLVVCGGGCGFFVGWFVFCCGQAACGAPVVFGLGAERGLLLPPTFHPFEGW